MPPSPAGLQKGIKIANLTFWTFLWERKNTAFSWCNTTKGIPWYRMWNIIFSFTNETPFYVLVIADFFRNSDFARNFYISQKTGKNNARHHKCLDENFYDLFQCLEIKTCRLILYSISLSAHRPLIAKQIVIRMYKIRCRFMSVNRFFSDLSGKKYKFLDGPTWSTLALK